MNLSQLSALTQFGRLFPLKRKSKFPMKNWSYSLPEYSTDSILQIDSWLDTYPESNWALIPTHVFVLDVDIRADRNGFDSLATLGEFDDCDETLTVVTPSLSYHFYYAPDPDIPYGPHNSILPGIDIRYGYGCYVVCPGGKTSKGSYQRGIDPDELAPIPSFLKRFLVDQFYPTICNFTGTTKRSKTTERDVLYTQCNTLEPVRNQVKYRFFKKKDNARLWKTEFFRTPEGGYRGKFKALATMNDQSQSGFEWELAIRYMHVGATDAELATIYYEWTTLHAIPFKERFFRKILPEARTWTQPYIDAWKARQPIRRKRGTTTDQILNAIQNGKVTSKTISEACDIVPSSVRSQIKRLVEKRTITRTKSGYAVAA